MAIDVTARGLVVNLTEIVNNSVANLQEQIDYIGVTGGADVEVETIDQLPVIGTQGVTYFVRSTQQIQRWDATAQKYITYGGSTTPSLDISLINGGNSNG